MNPLKSILVGCLIGMIVGGCLLLVPFAYSIRQWVRHRRRQMLSSGDALDGVVGACAVVPGFVLLRAIGFPSDSWRNLDPPDQLLTIVSVAFGVAILFSCRGLIERRLEYRDYYRAERERFRQGRRKR